MLFKKTLSAFALTAMLIPASAYFATEANAQQICHNGVCWDLGDIGSECCPFSDSQLKTAVVPLTNSTEQILKIQGVKFKWKDSGREDVGVIAQNVQEAYPSLGKRRSNRVSRVRRRRTHFFIRVTPDSAISFAMSLKCSHFSRRSRQSLAHFAPRRPLWA